MTDRSVMTRRNLLGSGLALGGGLALSACGSNAADPSAGFDPGDDDKVRPAYVPYDGPEPDLVGDGATGVPNGFLAYPDPAPSTGRVPLNLSAPVQMMIQSPTLPTARDKNPWWKLWETDLGVELKMDTANSTDYKAKFTTAIAGDNIAEITQIMSVPRQPEMLEEMFTDLTPYLSGDNIKKYPNLASIPSASWDIGTITGKIWGVTNPRIPAGKVMMTRGDILDSKGIATMPKLSNGEDFLDMCREVTNRDAGVFAIGQIPQNWTLPLIVESLGGPNGWRIEDDGSWTHEIETPEYERGLEIVTSMFSEGLFHPNSYTELGSTEVWFDAGVTALFAQDFAQWQRKSAAASEYAIGGVVMPKWDGGGPAAKHLGNAGYGAPVGLAKTDDEARIDELLRVADYFASPFGSEEYLKVVYGVRGTHYELENGQISTEPDASDDLPIGAYYYGAQNAVNLYSPGDPDTTKQLFEYCKAHVPDGVANPSRGKFSETNQTKGKKISRDLGDLKGAIIQGRAKLSEWTAAVKKWKADGGDKIAEEYAAQA